MKAIEEIVDPATRGDPMRPLRWTSKSLDKIGEELKQQGFQVSTPTISKILREELDFSLQAQRKTKEGAKQHPDRDAQFQYLNQQCQDFQQRGQPVISVDAKKKEKVGEFKNGGREWQPKGKPVHAPTHDFEDKELGKSIPYGIWDSGRNEGWVSVGVDHDTAEFAVASIHGTTRLPASAGTADHRRRGRKQRLPRPALEARIAEIRRRNRIDSNGLPLSAGNQQMEQD
jgi:hypothetical protein